jgi:hypothetical protein
MPTNNLNCQHSLKILNRFKSDRPDEVKTMVALAGEKS